MSYQERAPCPVTMRRCVECGDDGCERLQAALAAPRHEDSQESRAGCAAPSSPELPLPFDTMLVNSEPEIHVEVYTAQQLQDYAARIRRETAVAVAEECARACHDQRAAAVHAEAERVGQACADACRSIGQRYSEDKGRNGERRRVAVAGRCLDSRVVRFCRLAQPEPEMTEQLKTEWRRECDDADRILTALGLSPDRYRTEGGSLKVAAIQNELARRTAQDRTAEAVKLLERTLQPGAYGLGSTLALEIERFLAAQQGGKNGSN